MVTILLIASGVSLVAGVVLGWLLGAANQRRRTGAEAFRDYALKANASFDFAAIRAKADQIVGLGNDIGKAAKKAQDTVHKEFGLHPGVGSVDNPSSFRAISGANDDQAGTEP